MHTNRVNCVHPGEDEPSHPRPAGLQAFRLVSFVQICAPRSRRHPSVVHLEALTSPPLPVSQDFPTVPGFPQLLSFLTPTNRAATENNLVAFGIAPDEGHDLHLEITSSSWPYLAFTVQTRSQKVKYRDVRQSSSKGHPTAVTRGCRTGRRTGGGWS